MFFGSRRGRLSDVWFGNVGGGCIVSNHRRNSSLYWFFNGGSRGWSRFTKWFVSQFGG